MTRILALAIAWLALGAVATADDLRITDQRSGLQRITTLQRVPSLPPPAKDGKGPPVDPKAAKLAQQLLEQLKAGGMPQTTLNVCCWPSPRCFVDGRACSWCLAFGAPPLAGPATLTGWMVPVDAIRRTLFITPSGAMFERMGPPPPRPMPRP